MGAHMPKTIPLTRGMATLVDDEDYAWLSKWTWYATEGRCGCFYAARGTKQRTYEMQREILDPERRAAREVKADHIDGNTLNNQRWNLRLVSNSVSNINRRIFKNNKSGYRGVWFSAEKRRFKAQISVSGTRVLLGSFDTAEEAAEAYNRAAIGFYGEYARLNCTAPVMNQQLALGSMT